MTRVPVDWNHVNKPPYPLLGGNMKKVGRYSVIPSRCTVSYCVVIWIVQVCMLLRQSWWGEKNKREEKISLQYYARE